MRLFGKNNEVSAVDKPLGNFLEDEPAPAEDTQKADVLNYLVDLSDDEYDKMFKVAKVYREANKKAGEIWGVGSEDAEATEIDHTAPASTLNDDEAAIDEFLNEDLETAFIEDTPPNTTRKTKKVN